MAKMHSLMANDRNTNLVVVFFLAMLVFNFPLLAIFGKDQSIFGIPFLYAYIFVVWLGIIILVFLISRKKNG